MNCHAVGQGVDDPVSSPILELAKLGQGMAKKRRRKRGVRERQEAESAARRRQSMAEVCHFLSGAGIECQPVGGEALQVRGTVVRAGPIDVTNAGARRRWIDELVVQVAPEQLLDSLREHLGSGEIGLDAVPSRTGYVVRRAKQPVALVCATHARLRQGGWISGNFLRKGTHWRELRARMLADQTVDIKSKPPEGILEHLPDALDPLLGRAALSASARIRLHRNLAFDYPVTLEFFQRQVRLEPIRRLTALEVPFAYRHGDNAFHGALRLLTPGDPLALAIYGSSDTELVGIAWALALCAYAELTCVEAPTVAPGSRPVGSEPSAVHRSFDSGRPTRPRSLPRPKFQYSASLTPSAETQVFLASYVAGHRRRLQPGQRHGHEAERHARAVGISLEPGETWVRPHRRGAPDLDELRFSWRPAGLQARLS
jgi:hypothetical protein